MVAPVLVRWLGHPSAFDDPGILKRLAHGTLSVATVEALRRYDKLRVGLSPGAERALGPGSLGGFSRTYLFRPATAANPSACFQWMDAADAALLFGNPWNRWEFVDATEPPRIARRPMADRDWLRLLHDFSMIAHPDGRPRRSDVLGGKPLMPAGLARHWR